MIKLTLDQCKEAAEKASHCSALDFYTQFGLQRFSENLGKYEAAFMSGCDKAALEIGLSTELQKACTGAIRCAFRSGCIAGIEAFTAPAQPPSPRQS